MKTLVPPMALAATLSFAVEADAARFDAKNIELRDVTGEVRIVTNSGEAVDVTVTQGKDYHGIDVALVDGVVIVTGERWKEDDNRNCCDNRITRFEDRRKDREMTTGAPVDNAFFETYPVIEIVMPRAGDATFVDARMKLAMGDIDGALNLDACYVYGEAGAAGEAVIGLIDGSRLVMARVESKLEIDLSGDADFRAGDAAMVDVDMAGPGDVILGAIDGMLDVSIAGSGLVRAARLDGPLMARIAGSGAVAVQAGRADGLKAVIDGSGGVFFDGAAEGVDLKLFGSAEVRMKSVKGRILRAGSGAVYVNGALQPK